MRIFSWVLNLVEQFIHFWLQLISLRDKLFNVLLEIIVYLLEFLVSFD